MENVKLEVSNEIVRPIIEAKINSVLLDAFTSNKEAVIKEIVERTLRVKVDETGNINKDRYYNQQEYFDWVVQKCIRDVALNAFNVWVEKHKPEIEKNIKKILDENKKGIIEAYLKKFTTNLNSNCGIAITFNR